MKKELCDLELEKTAGGKNHYREPTASELVEIKQFKQEKSNLLSELRDAPSGEKAAIRDKLADVMYKLHLYLEARSIDPKYKE